MDTVSIIDKDVLDVIRKNYSCIFPAERKAADFVLQNPGTAVQYNVSELARASGVSDATIIRMCHHLGYNGYYQFRIALSRDLGKKQIQEPADQQPGSILQGIFDEYTGNIAAVSRGLDLETLQQCVQLLKEAGTVHIISVGNTTNIGKYMGFRMERLGVRCTYSGLPEYFINHIELADPRDIVVAITKSGYSKRVLDGLKLAREKELKTIVITAGRNSPAADMADFQLDSEGLRPSGDIYKEYSYLNEFVIVETLINLVANKEWFRKQQAERLEMLLAENKW